MFYEPVVSERHFAKKNSYADVAALIASGNFDGVVYAFGDRIDEWYLAPVKFFQDPNNPRHAETGHFAFAVVALDCLLIDTLSQFVLGKLASKGKWFTKFIRDYLPSDYSHQLIPSITHYDHKSSPSGKPLGDVADVLWNGFRCGILHQAHAPLYCSINPGGPRVEHFPPGKKATYGPGYGPGTPPGVGGCPNIRINPWLLFDDLCSFFMDYISRLLDRSPANDGLRTAFKTKFSDSFGLDINSMT